MTSYNYWITTKSTGRNSLCNFHFLKNRCLVHGKKECQGRVTWEPLICLQLFDHWSSKQERTDQHSTGNICLFHFSLSGSQLPNIIHNEGNPILSHPISLSNIFGWPNLKGTSDKSPTQLLRVQLTLENIGSNQPHGGLTSRHCAVPGGKKLQWSGNVSRWGFSDGMGWIGRRRH